MPKQSPSKSGTSEQVLGWIQQYQEADDNDAQTNLVMHYERLVHSIARKYSNGKHYHEDLVQVGMLGLLGAIRRYDPDYGRSFEAFAVPTIIGEIKRFIRDKTWSVHVPRRIKELGPKIKRAVDELTTANQKSPSIKEIAEYLEASEEEILETMEMSKSYKALSVDRKVEGDSDGGTVAILDIVGNTDDGYDNVDQKIILEKILPILSEREQEILKYTY